MDEFEYVHRVLEGYRLVTAEILYHMPDHPNLLQTYVWQEIDLPPRYPCLHKFIRFWNENLDGPVHSVRVAHSTLTLERRPVHRVHGEFFIH